MGRTAHPGRPGCGGGAPQRADLRRMSDVSQGPGWWQASDGKWYPPTAKPGTAPAAPPRAPDPSYRPPTVPPSPYGPPPGYGYGYGYALNPNGTATGLPSVAGL